MIVALSVFAGFALSVAGHCTPWNPGQYAFNGTDPTNFENGNVADTSQPLFNLTRADWWMHGTLVSAFPPVDGSYLELPAGGSFTVEMSQNKGQTSFAFGGQFATEWPDGGVHPDDWNCSPGCCGQLHTNNLSMVAGSAFAISYVSELSAVTPENLVVFTVNVQTPWKRIATFEVPKDLPACPAEGCICTWGWVPNGCGEPNMYMIPYRCMVTGSTSIATVRAAQPPTCCYGDPTGCVTGPRQMLYWNQLDGNNIDFDQSLDPPQSPGYNPNCGFQDGAQTDIFLYPAATTTSTTSMSTSTSTSTSTPMSMSTPISTSTSTSTSISTSTSTSTRTSISTSTTTTSTSTSTSATTSSSAASVSASGTTSLTASSHPTPSPSSAAQSNGQSGTIMTFLVPSLALLLQIPT